MKSKTSISHLGHKQRTEEQVEYLSKFGSNVFLL